MYENISNASSGQWWCVFNKIQGVAFKLQNFPIPNISCNPTQLGEVSNIQIAVPGSHIQYEPLQLDFLVDSDYKNYLSVLKWMRANTLQNDNILDSCIVYLTKPNQHLNQVPNSNGVLSSLSFEFTNCFPINLQTLSLDSIEASTDLQCSLTVQFEDMCINECC